MPDAIDRLLDALEGRTPRPELDNPIVRILAGAGLYGEEGRQEFSYRRFPDKAPRELRSHFTLLKAQDEEALNAVTEKDRSDRVARFVTGGIPFVSSLLGRKARKEYEAAVERYKADEYEDDDKGRGQVERQRDAHRIARYEQEQNLVSQFQKKYPLTAAGSGAMALVGESVIGGAPLRALAPAVQAGGAVPSLLKGGTQLAAHTAVTPSLYAHGSSESDTTNFVRGMILNKALGSVGRASSSVTSQVPTTFGRATGRATVGAVAFPVEQQAADALTSVVDEFLPEAMQFKTKYGLVGHMLNGEEGVAKEATTQAVMGAVFAAAHATNPKARKAAFDAEMTRYRDFMDAQRAKGFSEKAAAKRWLEAYQQAMERETLRAQEPVQPTTEAPLERTPVEPSITPREGEIVAPERSPAFPEMRTEPATPEVAPSAQSRLEQMRAKQKPVEAAPQARREGLQGQYPDLPETAGKLEDLDLWMSSPLPKVGRPAKEPVDASRMEMMQEKGARTTPEELGKGELYSGFPFGFKALDKMTEWVFGKARGSDPQGFRLDTDPNPDNPRAMTPHDIGREAAATQLGARKSSDAELAITTYAWEVHQGRQLANVWLLGRKPGSDPFPKAKDGTVELANGQRGYLADVIEAELRAPGSQPLTPPQRAAVQMWANVRAKQEQARVAEGLKPSGDPAYFHRAVIEAPSIVEAGKQIIGAGGKPGAKQSIQKKRSFDTEAEGAQNGVKYKSFHDSIADYIEQSNRQIADHRLANDPLLGGVEVWKKTFKALLAENKGALADITDRAEKAKLVATLKALAIERSGNVHIAPAFKGKEYDPLVKALLETMYGERTNTYLSFADAVGKELKQLVLSADMSYGTLQLQSMLVSNPVRWAKAMAAGGEGIFNPDALRRRITSKPEYQQAVNEMVQAGGQFNTLPDLAHGAGQKATLASKIPLLDRFTRAMSTAIDTAKIELWLANRPKNKAEFPRAMEAIENVVGQGRMEQLGMTPGRAFLERFLFLSPSFYRSHFKLLQQALQGGAPGKIARKQLGALAGAAIVLPLAGLYALKSSGQISDEELEERLNPSRGKFLMVPVKLGDKRMEVGFGGLYLSVLRTLAQAKDYATDQRPDNPMGKFYRGHAGMVPRIVADLLTGEDVQGEPVTWKGSAANLLPLPLQEPTREVVRRAEGEEGQSAAQLAVGAGAGFAGLRSWDEPDAEPRMEKLRALAKEKYGKRYEELNLIDQARINKAVGERESTPASASQQERGAAMAKLRQERLVKAVKEETRGRLKTLKHALPGYDPTISIGGVHVRLSREQAEAYEKLLAEEYDRTVAAWKMPNLQAVSAKRREDYIVEQLKNAKERAQIKLIKTWKR